MRAIHLRAHMQVNLSIGEMVIQKTTNSNTDLKTGQPTISDKKILKSYGLSVIDILYTTYNSAFLNI